MKKMFMFLSFIVTLTVCMFYPLNNVCHAKDVWVWGNSIKNIYVISESFDYSTNMEPYSMSIKAKFIMGGGYEILHYTFYLWDVQLFSSKSTKNWYYATQFMNREDPELVSSDTTGRARAVLKYCLGRL